MKTQAHAFIQVANENCAGPGIWRLKHILTQLFYPKTKAEDYFNHFES